jgi:hypothetical protein
MQVIGGRMDELAFKDLLLTRTTWALQTYLSKELCDSANVDIRVFLDDYIGSIVLQLKGSIFYENLERIEYPCDWWQALKGRWFPGWALERWPVRYKRYEINAYYPTIRASNYHAYVAVPRMEGD